MRAASLEAGEHGMVAHQLPEVDVVALVDRREARREDITDPAPTLTLRCGLSAGAGALTVTRDDGLEVAVHQGTGVEHALAILIEEAGIGIERDIGRAMPEADPGGSHDIGVDVIEQVVHGEVFHTQIQPLV